MTDVQESLLTFPCDLPIKVFGRNDPSFRDTAVAIVREHYGAEPTVSEHVSSRGAYMSLTITVHAQSRAQMDAIFQALVASSEILMVL